MHLPRLSRPGCCNAGLESTVNSMYGSCQGSEHSGGAVALDANLKARIAAAAVLIPLAVAAVLWLPAGLFAGFVAAFVLIGAWEWAALSGVVQPLRKMFYVAMLGLVLWALWWIPQWGQLALWLGLIYWTLCTLFIALAQRGARLAVLDNKFLRGAAGVLTLVPAWWALVDVRRSESDGPWLVLLLFVLVWGADIGAYFAGRRWGRRKLAVRVSPGKTWEGSLGGVATVMVVAVIFWGMSPLSVLTVGPLLLVCLVVGVVSVIGDLTESLFKRRAGIKDSGGLIPGHGGVLDRVDSITAAAPCFALGLATLGTGGGA